MITLDGNYGEGGGQIIRTALALSAVTGKAFTVNNIRKGRCVSGLKAEHLACIKALQEMCDASVEGAELGSHEVTFIPKALQGKTISIDIGTAGSITLLLQSLLIPAFFADKPTRLKITGGTDVKWSMPVDYFSQIVLPHLRAYADIDFKVLQRGYFPKGQGKIDLKIKPRYTLATAKEARKINLLKQEKLVQIKGISHASADLQQAQVSERQAGAAKHDLTKLNIPVKIVTEYHETASPGSGITLFALFGKNSDFDIDHPISIGADALGEKTKKAEEVGKEAAERLINEISYGAPVDEYLADNLIPFLAFFGGQIKVSKITNHALTNIYATEQFLGKKFAVDKENKTISTSLL